MHSHFPLFFSFLSGYFIFFASLLRNWKAELFFSLWLDLFCLSRACYSHDNFYHCSLLLHVRKEQTVPNATFSSVPLWHLQLARPDNTYTSVMVISLQLEGLWCELPWCPYHPYTLNCLGSLWSQLELESTLLIEELSELLLPSFIRMLTVSPSVFLSLEENLFPLVLPKLLDSKCSRLTHTRYSSVKSLLKLNSCSDPENCRWPCSQGTSLITARARSRQPRWHLMRTFGTSWR